MRHAGWISATVRARPAEDRSHEPVIELPPVDVHHVHGPLQQHRYAPLGLHEVDSAPRRFPVRQKRHDELILGRVAPRAAATSRRRLLTVPMVREHRAY